MDLKLSEYANFLDHTSLNSSEVEDTISTYKLTFISIRNKKIEWETKLPPFIRPFYLFIYKSKRVPTQDEYFDFYISKNSEYFNLFKKELLIGVKARLFRTYPSLIRDLHFSLLLKESLDSVTVFYNTSLDTKYDIDILLINTRYFGLALYTDTPNAIVARSKKKFRHNRFSNVEYVEIPVAFKASKECGRFFLYGDRELKKVKKIVSDTSVVN